MLKTDPIIELKDLTKTFVVGGKPLQILKGVSLSVDAGEMVAITGPSGNGKSTTLNMITGIDRPSSGEVWVNGVAVHELSESKLAVWRGVNLGIVFQFFQLLPSLSLAQNVALPMEFAGKYRAAERRPRALELLELVGLADQADKLPGEVSGGQQQRAAIARALANDPPLIVADEPTGNLDASTAESIFELFQGLAQAGKTILMVTHDIELANRMPRIIEVRNGVIACDSIVAPEIFNPAAKPAPVER